VGDRGHGANRTLGLDTAGGQNLVGGVGDVVLSGVGRRAGRLAERCYVGRGQVHDPLWGTLDESARWRDVGAAAGRRRQRSTGVAGLGRAIALAMSSRKRPMIRPVLPVPDDVTVDVAGRAQRV
jgi:hypothetical protein